MPPFSIVISVVLMARGAVRPWATVTSRMRRVMITGFVMAIPVPVGLVATGMA
ncbi:MAG: hypothetical protein J3Q66DRAFT_334889 [Benniella sp.]|nr:MAG: hypothetical protein J3Q66DRAFT_334889 [Benniella sp.]